MSRWIEGTVRPLARRKSQGDVPSRRRYDDVLDLRHMATGDRGGFVRSVPALTRVHVRRVPVPPVVPRGDGLERAVMFGGFVQELRKRRDVDRHTAAREPLRDLLEHPAVAV